MKRNEIVEIYKALKGSKELTGLKLAYAINKNIDIVEREIKPIAEVERIIRMPDPKYLEYQAQSEVITGNPDLSVKEIGDKIEALNKQYPEVLKKTAKLNKEYLDLMAEEIDEPKFHKIKMEFIPDEITVDQLKGLKFMIEDY